MLSFTLSEDFVSQYKEREVNWGYKDAGGNSLGEITFLRTYSRLKEDGTKERWWEVCERVINGMFSIQKDHCRQSRLPWNDRKAHATAQDAFDRLFNFKWTPPGRGLWMMGTPLVNKQRNSAALQNCSFVSTGDMTKYDPAGPFTFLMEASMLGIGVGFDTKGAEKDFSIYNPTRDGAFVIPDSREGWVESLKIVLEAYLMPHKSLPVFDYSQIRPAGEPIKTFGGTAAGPGSLIKMHDKLVDILSANTGKKLTSRLIADIGNLIGVCVVSGNVRRSAELLLGDINDDDFLSLKDYNGAGASRAEWSWMSNNSVAVNVGDDLSKVISGIAQNGEPGVVWMDTSRNYGRLADAPNYKDHRASGYNPCAEQTLESFEMCVSGDTMIQTETGMVRIDDVVDTDVRVWNGKQWSTVRPFYTGRNSLYRVTLSDGSYLDATPGHEWQAKRKTERAFKKFKTTELEVGMSLPEFSLVAPDGKPAEYAYAWGWVAGDGYIDGNNVMAIVKCDEYSVLTDLGGVAYKEQSFNNGSEVRYSRVNVSTSVPLHAAVAMRKEDRLPDEVFGWDIESIANFVGAWIDTDGSVIRQQNTDHYVLYGSEGKLRQLQMLLRRIGVDHATLRLFAEKGSITNKGVRTHDLYRLLIPSYEAANVATKIKVAEKFGARTGVNNAHADSTIDRARKQKIVSVELISEDADTYCFNEPEEHMGVFGNVLTHQCTLVETYLNRHDTLEDYKKTLKVAYLYGKTVTLLPTHFPRTNAIMQRNRRIGTSMSGIANFADNRGIPTLREWMDQGYNTIQKLDKSYSEWLCVRESIKTTTVKPSGTVSILAGESPGVHWSPGGEYFLRSVRFGKDDPMVKQFSIAGYTIEPAIGSEDTTVVVYFPIKSNAARSEHDVTLFEKASLAATAQRYWSDNSVSVTLSFDPENEGQHVGSVLGMYEGQLKTVSFLPMLKEGAYAQMPYGTMSAEDYDDAKYSLWPVDLTSIYDGGQGVDAEGEQFCTTDICLVKEETTDTVVPV